jgi:hypothetical protein
MNTKMKVTVADRFAQTQSWGHGRGGAPPLRTVEISCTCPVCGGPRGKPGWMRTHEDGDWFDISVWANPCGHLDKYAAVLIEAGVYRGDEKITNHWAGPDWLGTKQIDC